MQVSVDIRGMEEVQRTLQGIGRQARYATSLGINATVNQAQQVMQNRMPQVFHLRGTEQLFRRAVKRSLSTKTKLEGNVRIEGPQGGDISAADRVSSMILRHEENAPRISNTLYRMGTKMQAGGFYLPVEGLRTNSSNPPRKLYPVNIGMTLRVDPDGRAFFADTRKGKKIKRKKPQRELSYFATPRGIYERKVTGFGTATRMIWAFRRRIAGRGRLFFARTIDTVVQERIVANIEAGIAEAMRTALPPGTP